MRILGIETSCDETAAAVVEVEQGDKAVKLLSNVVASSLALHAKTGGIIPEVAAREQVKYIIPVIEESLRVIPSEVEESLSIASDVVDPSTRSSGSVGMTGKGIDAIAVTVGPGLIGSLLVGVETAKTLAFVWNKPIIPVNHLIGHIYANWVLTTNPSTSLRTSKLEVDFPALALIVSGGHTDLVLMRGHQRLTWLGGTRDDAAGEAFDKIGRLLGLPYPGGSAVAKIAEIGNPKAFNFPRPMIDSNDLDFSFSGLKTAVFRSIKTMKQLNNKTITNIAASVQQAIVDVLVAKTVRAAQKFKVKSILLGGGVAANDLLRRQIQLNAKRLARQGTSSAYTLNAEIFVPQKFLCTDNAAMIASAAFFNHKPASWKKIKVDPSLHF